MAQTSPSIKVLQPNQGESLWALGEKLTFKLGTEDTGGEFGFAELVAQPGGGPPPHIHRREDEMFYVLDGDFTFVVGDRTFTRSPGFAAYLHRNVLHTYNNVGTRPGRMLTAVAPCGFEQFIREWSHPVRDPMEPPPQPLQQDIDKLIATAPEYGIELHPEFKAIPDASVPPTDRAYWVLGQLVTFKLVSPDTAGHFSVVEVSSFPGEGVLPHLHLAMEELFYILDEAFEFTFGSRVERVEPGGLVFVPRGTLHSFRSIDRDVARLFDVHSPGGFEAFFEEAGTPAKNPTRRRPRDRRT